MDILAQNIQPPSFDDFDGGSYQGEGGIVPVNNNSFEESTSADAGSGSAAYRVPLSFIDHTDGVWFGLFSVAMAFSAIIFAIILYSLFRVVQIRLAERERFANAPMSPEVELLLGSQNAHGNIEHGESQNIARWQQVLRHSQSENPSEWRLAIIEADIILDELITSKGYSGEGLGEKLKQVKQEDLNSIEAAWEAHKIRNQIAHEGSAHQLSEREVKRVVGLYGQVFKEMKFV